MIRRVGRSERITPAQKFLEPKDHAPLEHNPEKWKPVFRKDHAPLRILERQSIQSEAIAL
jgi:hypothetical protein